MKRQSVALQEETLQRLSTLAPQPPIISTGSVYGRKTMSKMVDEAWAGEQFELTEEKRKQPVKFLTAGGEFYVPPGRGESLPTETAAEMSSCAAAAPETAAEMSSSAAATD